MKKKGGGFGIELDSKPTKPMQKIGKKGCEDG